MRTRPVILVVVGAFAACRSAPPPVRVASAEATSVDGRHSAHVEVHFIKGFSGIHSSVSDEVNHVLVVDGQNVIVERFLDGTIGRAIDLRAASKANFTLRFAPDGHAISLNDGGPSWSHVVLDTGAPFRCSGDGLEVPPPTRELVRQSLSSFARPLGDRSCQLDGLTRVLCAAKDDEALWSDALAPSLSATLVDSERSPLLECLRATIATSSPIRSRVLRGLSDPNQVETAAEALVSQTEVDVELALTQAMADLAHLPESRSRCWKQAKLSWALASVVVARKAATRLTLAHLQSELLADPACPNELTGKAARVHALLALAAIGDETVKSFASKCTGAPIVKEVRFKQWNEVMVDGLVHEPIECLAKGLAR